MRTNSPYAMPLGEKPVAPVVLAALLVATMLCLALAPAVAHADTQAATTTAGTLAQPAATAPTSAQLSDDGVDYGWLYRKGDYWYRVAQYSEGGFNSAPPTAVLGTDEAGKYVWDAYRVGDYPGDQQLTVNETGYHDGVLVYQRGSHIRLASVVNSGDAISWAHDPFAIAIYSHLYKTRFQTAQHRSFAEPNVPVHIAGVKNGYLDRADIRLVEFDETLDPIWGSGYGGPNGVWRSDRDALIYLDRWFEGCTNLKAVTGLEHISTGDALTMAGMFRNCKSLEELDLSTLDTRVCEDLKGMFDGCLSLVTLKMGENWSQAGVDTATPTIEGDRGKATFPIDMFRMENDRKVVYREGDVIPDGAAEYTVANRANIKHAKVLLADPTTAGAATSALTCEYTGNPIEPSVQVTFEGKQLAEGVDYTVAYDNNVETGTAHVNITGIGAYYGYRVADFAIVDTGAYAFLYDNGVLCLKANHHAPSGTLVAASSGLVAQYRCFDAETANPGSAVPWKAKANAVKRVIIDPSFAHLAPTTAANWFAGCTALTSVEGLENLNLSKATSVAGMFKGCTKLTSMSLVKLDLSRVTNASGLFEGCTALTSASVPFESMKKAQNLSGFFKGCTALKTLSLAGAQLPAATNLNGFCRGCTALESVSLKGMSAPKAQNLGGMFQGCISLTSVDFAGSSFPAATSLANFFSGCRALVNLDISGLSAPRAQDLSGFLAGCSRLETLAIGGLASAGKADMSALLAGCPRLTTLKTSAAFRNAAADKSKLKFASRAYRLSPDYARQEAGTAVPAGAGEYRLRDLAMQFTKVVMQKSKYTCTGKAIKPAVRVMLGDVELQEGEDYTLSYKNNVYPGKASVTIKGKGALSGGLVAPFRVVAQTTKAGDRLVYETDEAIFTVELTKVVKKNGVVKSAKATLVGVKVKAPALRSMSIPDSCTVGGVKITITEVNSKLTGQFKNVRNVWIGPKVVKIGSRAFAKAPKVRKLYVKSARLTSVKNCLKGSKVKEVETRVHLSKSKQKTYKKWFTQKSGRAGVKFTYGIYAVFM